MISADAFHCNLFQVDNSMMMCSTYQ